MKLYLTPLSHFSRKVVIVASELGLEYERQYVSDLLSDDPAEFGGNPILRVPVLEDGEHWIVESDSIVRHLVDRHDPADRFGLHAFQPPQRNAAAMIAAVMGAEVELILSQRSGAPQGRFFERYGLVIEHGLSWLERNGPAVWPSAAFSYLDVALICMWDHLAHSRSPEPIGSFPWIGERVDQHAERASVRDSSPARMQELQWKLYPGQRPTP